MKYLKKYEEKSDMEMRIEIQDLCGDCLSFIIDKGYNYGVITRGNHIEIFINHKDMVGGLIGDVITDIIPLYEILLRKYDLFYCGISYSISNRELPDYHEIDKLLILSDEFIINYKDKYLSELKIGIRKF